MADSKGPSASGTPLPEMDPSGGIPSELGLNPSGTGIPSRAGSSIAVDASRPPSSAATAAADPTSVAADPAADIGSGDVKRVRVADPPDDASPRDEKGEADEKHASIAPGQPGWADAADAGDSDTESVADLDPNHVRYH